MANVHHLHNFLTDASNSNLSFMVYYEEQFCYGTNNALICTTFWNPRQAVRESAVYLQAELKSNDEDPISNAMSVPKTLPEHLDLPHLWPGIEMIAQEEGRRIYTFNKYMSLIKAEKHESFILPGVVTMDHTNGLNYTLNCFVDILLTEMVHTVTIHKMLKRSNGKWTNPFACKNPCKRFTPTSSRFVHQSELFRNGMIEKKCHEVGRT